MPVETQLPRELLEFQENITTLAAGVENDPKFTPKNPIPKSTSAVVPTEFTVESIVEMPREEWTNFSLSQDMITRLSEVEVVELINLDSPVVLYEVLKQEAKPESAQHVVSTYEKWMSSENKSLTRELTKNEDKRSTAHRYMLRHAVGLKKILEWMESLDEPSRTEAATKILVNSAVRWLIDTQIINSDAPYESWPMGAKVGYARVVGAVADTMDERMKSFDDQEHLIQIGQEVSANLPEIYNYQRAFNEVMSGCACEAVVKKFIEERMDHQVDTSDSREDALNGFDLKVYGGNNTFYLDIKTSGYLDVVAIGKGEEETPFTFRDSGGTVDLESCKTPRSLIEFAQRGNMCLSVRVPLSKFFEDAEMQDHLKAKLDHAFEVLERRKDIRSNG
ncbi:hypothetical protein C4561_02325 [candidate division WWE3 bacterium]|jgi:hypothetical protein|uniref:Uncharacterized protein n=1 Tax=candidate division WWE3 bacterium TaxID=2053526 RepID=A0A3A4ZLG1_UNCKA|nr:MAG: hypothetical protein C4561_02325 [candidate division WWE3 bacterium]